MSNIRRRHTSTNILYRLLDRKTFLVLVPTASVMSVEELRIKGMVEYKDNNDTRNLDVKSEMDIYKEKKSKKKQPKRDTTFDSVVMDGGGNELGQMSETDLKYFIKKRRKKKVSKRDNILKEKTEIYLPISGIMSIAKDGFTIRLLDNNDLKEMYNIINEVLNKIENSLNVSNSQLENDLKEFLKEMTNLNTQKLTNDIYKQDTYIDDIFGTDIFMTSPTPRAKKYNIKDIKG